jgi:RepB DNA-primase from phage plasmid
MNKDTAAHYLLSNFEPRDRLAVVLVHKGSGSVLQRLATTEQIAAPDFQAWLRHKNAREHEIYVSMNVLRPDARGRTKTDVAMIRHVYLDFDDHGTEAVERLLKRSDLPRPNYLLNTSPDKWQAVWKVDGFAKDQAEDLQRGLARETAADPAATDCSRVLRLPGFYNHKYANKHLVDVQNLSAEVYGPERFPKFGPDERAPRAANGHSPRVSKAPGGISQSERDWAFAKRALARGDPEHVIVTAIAAYRRFDKYNPQAYAELTVRKAAESLRAESLRQPTPEEPRR